jgi:hypothetical protein
MSGTGFWDPLGIVESVVAGTNVTVDATDPANPIVSADDPTAADVKDLGRWEVVVSGVPAEATTNEAGDDWLYHWIGA